MQTFMPRASFEKSAACLDNKRLNKQRVECIQILKALRDPTYGWQNHPAVKMWRGYEAALIWYALCICNECDHRGIRDLKNTKQWFLDQNESIPVSLHQMPPWWGKSKFHASHRSNLLRKDPVWYGKFGWEEPNNLPYYWPTKEK